MAEPHTSSPTTDVLVIGAGMAGVTAARAILRSGLSVLILEGRERLGGRVWSIRDFCGAPVEAGAEFVHGTRAATWPEIRAAGLSTRPCPLVRHTMFNLGGATRWLPRHLLHPGCWPTFTLRQTLARLRPPDLSAAELLRRRGYRGRARHLAAMMLTAHLPGSLEEVGVLGLVADGVLTLESGLNFRLDRGYDRLAEFVAGGLDIRFGFTVEQIGWGKDGVAVRAVDGRELVARAAVTTLPVGVLQSGAVRFVPPLPASKRSALEGLVMGPVVKLLLRFRERFWPAWLASLCCATGPITLYWPPFYRSEERSPVLVAYATGARAARLAELDDEQAADLALADLERLLPKTGAHRQLLGFRRIDWTADPFARGGYTFLRPGARGARAKLAASDTRPLFWAGSATVSSPIAATVEAAYTSGLRAAREIVEHLAA